MAWFKSHWIAAVVSSVLFFIGVGIGAAGSDSEGEDAEPARAEAATVTGTEAETDTETVTETVDPTAAQLEALEERAASLNEREAAVKERQQDVTARERKVKRAESVIARSRFDDGVYLVGKDVPPGSYIAQGGEACYWARLEQGSQEIIDNHIGSGQVRVTINRGELFETQDCGTWRRG